MATKKKRDKRPTATQRTTIEKKVDLADLEVKDEVKAGATQQSPLPTEPNKVKVNLSNSHLEVDLDGMANS